MLSFFAKLIFTTTLKFKIAASTLLWFAFVLCKTDIYNNGWKNQLYQKLVVICFRSLQNWYLQQQILITDGTNICCDLLSFFAKLIFTTTLVFVGVCFFRLWFAFVLCKTDIYNNCNFWNWHKAIVVICFRSLQNWYLQQHTLIFWLG